MGRIFYGDSPDPIEVDDHTLAHLKVVIATKLRRNESFMLSWPHRDADAPGRSTVWVHPSIPLRFTFDEPVAPALDPRWLSALSASANSSGGISLAPDQLQPVEEDDDAEDGVGPFAGAAL